MKTERFQENKNLKTELARTKQASSKTETELQRISSENKKSKEKREELEAEIESLRNCRIYSKEGQLRGLGTVFTFLITFLR